MNGLITGGSATITTNALPTVAITGHTSGIGRHLFENIPNTIGFSRTNGFDIADYMTLINEAQDCDVFINNAYQGFDQLHLLYALWEHWKKSDKLIINISTIATTRIINEKKHRDPVQMYPVHKHALDAASEHLSNQRRGACKTMCIKLGLVSVPRLEHIIRKKLDVQEVTKVVNFAIDGWREKLFFIPAITLVPC